MSVLQFPKISWNPEDVTWSRQTNTMAMTSPLSFSEQTKKLPGSRWAATLRYNNLREEDFSKLFGFISSLDGASGRFYFGPFWKHVGSTTFNSSASTHEFLDAPVINGASQTGTTLSVSGCTPSQSSRFKLGDYISYDTERGRKLHIITEDSNSDGAGVCSLKVSPSVGTSPANGDIVNYTTPTCQMRLKDDDQAKISLSSSSLLGSMAIEFVETSS